MTVRRDSGSNRSPRAVDPVTSLNRIVTVRRTSRWGTAEDDSSGVAHSRQNFALAGFSSPQDGQRIMNAECIGWGERRAHLLTPRVSDARGKATITDNDPPAITINDRSLLEGDSGTVGMVFTVRPSSTSASNVTVDFRTTSSTATGNVDYSVKPLTSLTIAAGQTSRTITIGVKGDTVHGVHAWSGS